MRRPFALALSAVSLAAVGAVAGVTAPATAATGTRPVARGFDGAVVSDTVQSTDAGLAVLRAGGTAADAAVAVAATLGVTDPFVAGIGGGGYFVYYDAATHTVSTIDGRETTPAGDSSTMFIDPATGKPLSFPTAVTSGLSVGVPGNLATWQAAVSHWGNNTLAQDLKPAITVADQGFPVTPTFQEQTRENAFRFDQFSSTAALFLPGGQLPEVGSTFRNPDLANTYRLIARHGTDALYGGVIGSDVVNAVHNLPLAPDATLTPIPGSMTLGDLRSYQAIDQAPTHSRYRGLDIYGMAPSSSGGITVGESLNILGNFPMSSMSKVEALHRYLEATKLAFADRNRYIGDSAFVNVPQQALLSTNFARQRACLINPDQTLPAPVAPGDPFVHTHCTVPPPDSKPVSDGAHTNHLVVADRWGNVASYTNTIEELGGSGIVVPGRGFLLNNELTDFNFAPTQGDAPDPNLPAPGKRPRSSMSPTIVLQNGRPFLAVGSPGGASIITTVTQILVNRIDFGMTLPQAIAAPRGSQRNSPTTQAEPAFIAAPYEPGLVAFGHTFTVSDTSPLNPAITIPPTIGAAAGLEFLGNGEILAAGEPTRRGGTSAGVVTPASR